MRVLIVEDHQQLREAISRRLRSNGHSVDMAETVAGARQYLTNAEYDVAILDRMLPDGDSLSAMRELRAQSIATPILLLTALSEVNERVNGLQAGADDYLAKPFEMDELLARVSALARRQTAPRPSVLRIADLEVDTGRREVRRAEILLPLRPKEYSLIELLASRAGRVVSRQAILEGCWDPLESPDSNVEESVIASLRRKLGSPSLIRTVRGQGYCLDG